MPDIDTLIWSDFDLQIKIWESSPRRALVGSDKHRPSRLYSGILLCCLSRYRSGATSDTWWEQVLGSHTAVVCVCVCVHVQLWSQMQCNPRLTGKYSLWLLQAGLSAAAFCSAWPWLILFLSGDEKALVHMTMRPITLAFVYFSIQCKGSHHTLHLLTKYERGFYHMTKQ